MVFQTLEAIQDIWMIQRLSLRTGEHLYMFGVALVIAIFIGVAMGLALYRSPRLANTAFNFLNVVETVPTLALLVLMIPFLGIGSTPTIFTSILYAILPVARNTYTGLAHVDKEYLDVATAMGLPPKEILMRIRIPLAMPLIAGGIRIALVFTMGVVTLGGIIAAGGLGAPLQTGIHLYDKKVIMMAGLWVGVLAVILDWMGGIVEKKLEVSI
jgi:osmoprotectant transport system permease protein